MTVIEVERFESMGRMGQKVISNYLRLSKLLLVAGLVAFSSLAVIGCGEAGEEGVGPSEAPPSDATNLIAPVTITNPSSALVSNASQITISGSCLATTTVVLAGSAQASMGCTNRTFSFSVSKSTDAVFTFYVTQGFSSTRVSSPVSVTWTRDTVAPLSPTVTNPTSNPAYTDANTLTISGACETNATVFLTGSSTSSVTCASSAYSFAVSKSTDSTYEFAVHQTDSSGNISQAKSVQWTRDTVDPSAPSVTPPGSSAENTVTVMGGCEPNALVRLSGTESDSVNCNEAGRYEFTLSQTVAGAYSYSVDQVDRAGNASASTPFTWTYDATVPLTPIVQTPTSSPTYTNGNSVTISGLCTDGMTVHLTRSGDAPESTACSSGAFSFAPSKSNDGTYEYNVHQTSVANVDSASATVIWIRDTAAPSALTLATPASATTYSSASAFSFSGSCETGADVLLTGSATAATTCSSSSFSISVSRSTDATYSFTLGQRDRAGNLSSTLSRTWVRDTVAPSLVTITSHSSTHLSNANSVTLVGACEDNATVSMTGAATGTYTCLASAYILTISKTTDGIYNVGLVQTDRAGNVSGSRSFTWTRDTAAPLAPEIQSPASNPVTSSGGTLILAGSCETGATVNVSGDDTDSTACTSGTFSLTVDEASDGIYNYSVTQTDLAGNTSSAATRQWIRNSAVPATPVITAPVTSPYISNGNSLVISGTCVSGNSVEMTGDSTQSMTCTGGNTFSFTVSKSTDGSTNYSIAQRSVANILSAAVTVTWVRDTVAPSVPTVTKPVLNLANTFYSNADTLTIEGACETNALVSIAGDATASVTCAAGSYSINITKTLDATYSLLVRQTDVAGNISGSKSVIWVRDTVRPDQVTISSPTANPYISGDTSITLSGSCEASTATVTLSGDAAGTQTCSSIGGYTFTISKSTDATYNFSLTQADLAGNISLARAFRWTRDTSVPSTPVISAPAVSPFYSNSSSITITASCQTGLTPLTAVLNLFGDVSSGEVTSPAGSLAQNCNVSPKSYVVQKSVDGTYTFYLNQDNPNNALSSASAAITWIRDTVAPSVPTITTPSTTPFTSPGNLTISGACESNATVNLAGDSAQTVLCAAGAYTFNVVKSTDATYSFTISQTDRAGNSSSTSSMTWVRDSAAVQPPVITSPSINPLLNNASSITIVGTCATDYTVILGGNVVAGDVTSPASSLSQTCVGDTFSFVVAKAADSTYAFTLKQRFNGVDSSTVAVNWTRDTIAPTATLTATPPATNFLLDASFAFSSNDANATFVCSLDSSSFGSCSSPLSYLDLQNSAHTFAVRAVDQAGNVGNSATWTWTQAGYSTMALYHLNSATPTVDSGDFTQSAGFNNSLTPTGTLNEFTTGFFGSSRTFSTSSYYSASSNSSLNLGLQTLTVEGFMRVTALPSNGSSYTLVSKSGASPNLGWEVRLKRLNNTKYAMEYAASLNGTTQTVVVSNNFSFSANTWYYFAVTWNRGSVNFYLYNNGSLVGRGAKTIGTVGAASLFANAADLRIGASPTTGTGTLLWFQGQIDEVRLSQTVRPISYPTSEFTPD